MRSTGKIAVFILVLTSGLFAVVGDIESYGNLLTLHDLHKSGNTIQAASSGGLVGFDLETLQFDVLTNTSYLDHIRVNRFYQHSDGSYWISYDTDPTVVTVSQLNGTVRHFDLDFSEVNAFCGDSTQIFASYLNGLTPGVAQFQKAGSTYIFKDYFNQFPGDPDAIRDLAILGDTLYAATSTGVLSAYKNSANLKPQSAWKTLIGDKDVLDLAVADGILYVMTADSIFQRGSEGCEGLYGESGYSHFSEDGDNVYAVGNYTIRKLSDGDEIFSSSAVISDALISGDDLYLALENQGLTVRDLSSGLQENFRPNGMMELYLSSLAIDKEGAVYVCGPEGVAILDTDEKWHNLVFSKTEEAIHTERESDYFSADTLNIAYRSGGETAVYDALVASDGNLYFTTTDISVTPVSGQSADAEGPGAMTRIDLNDLYDYQCYDTTDNMFHGTEDLNGSAAYLKMSALTEGSNGEIWVLNPHTIEEETLVKLYANGYFRKYSFTESGDALQMLPEDLVFDNYGRLWIANHERQSDVPFSDGGITVYDVIGGHWRHITTSDGLISNDVISIDSDPYTGNIWVATPAGVQMIRLPSTIANDAEITMNPAIDGLSGKIPVKVRVDARGNKWILTESQGIQIYMSNNQWFNEGAGLTTENSDLLDDAVYDIVFDNERGYVYCLTESGLNRYDSEWTEERETMNNITAYPQPFLPGTDPYIVIDGLADQSTVSFVTLGGRVVHNIEPDDADNYGKQIVWDGILANGENIPRGVYLVLVSNYDGVHARTKIAVK